MVLGKAIPIFPVRSLRASLDYYVQVLGFKIDWEVSMVASVSRDKCSIMLCEGDQGHAGTWVWIGSEDIEPLYTEYTSKGATIRNPPTNYTWAYEMQIEDPDGHVLRIGSEPKDGQPVGPWRDMHGDLWVTSAAGGWVRAERSERHKTPETE